MGIETIVALSLLGGGTGLQALSQERTAKSQRKRQGRIDDLLTTTLGGEAPGGELQDLLMSVLNIGQDGGMQTLRRGGAGQALAGMETGMPFDVSDLFKSLEPIETRALEGNIAGMRAGASGLGERFGSAMMRGEGDMRTQAGEQAAARRAGIAQQSHEAAQGRRMQFGGMQASTLAQLLGMGQNREMGLLSLLAGQPAAQEFGQGAGQGMADMGQLLYLLPLLQSLSN
jgi:hypothetical protein